MSEQLHQQALLAAMGAMKPSASHQQEVTPLTAQEEMQFQQWAKANHISDVDHPDSKYDYRGYWRDLASKDVDQRKDYADGPHFPDTYKQHGHPTFSVESKYSRTPQDGGNWLGEAFVPSGVDPRAFTAMMELQRGRK